jgi:Rieske Fe-S protein
MISMNRKDFIVNACGACMGTFGFSGLLSSCRSTKYITGVLGTNGITVNADDFKMTQKGKEAYRSFIIISNEALQYPVCLYRFSPNGYSALWMRCTHQGAELQAAGDFLQCPAHGSEFNNKGVVTNGPASYNLRTFPITVSNNELFIDMRAK